MIFPMNHRQATSTVKVCRYHSSLQFAVLLRYFIYHTSLRYWTGVWAVVHVEIVRNPIDILSCVLHPFLYNFKSIYIGY